MNILSLIFIVVASLFGAVAALLIKKSDKLSFKFKKLFINTNMILGGVLYFISIIFTILALRLENLSMIYPMTALTYIWVLFLSKIYLKEKITKNKIIGVVFIVIGVVLVNLSW